MKLRVMLADDHAVYRDALSMWLELAPDMEVVAQAHDGYSLLQDVGLARPDVVCMDLNMPGLDGIETTRQLLQCQPNVKVIGLSASVDLLRVAQMFQAGVLGYVLKGSGGGELLAAIRKVSQNLPYFDPTLTVKEVFELAPYLNPAWSPQMS
jgi:DNA-binding NarL/FixJ family response regulator